MSGRGGGWVRIRGLGCALCARLMPWALAARGKVSPHLPHDGRPTSGPESAAAAAAYPRRLLGRPLCRPVTGRRLGPGRELLRGGVEAGAGARRLKAHAAHAPGEGRAARRGGRVEQEVHGLQRAQRRGLVAWMSNEGSKGLLFWPLARARATSLRPPSSRPALAHSHREVGGHVVEPPQRGVVGRGGDAHPEVAPREEAGFAPRGAGAEEGDEAHVEFAEPVEQGPGDVRLRHLIQAAAAAE